ncbi:uncharacterized protein LOC129725284 [Wyeomyia smithii]|uniref:uncharacterized protein LOC129725284 n=1 Tax=Wyeomyia smithii TaxID=174621 RepID=UPI00246806A8|nr:uncharacterized protein LOC129725284 [Wyeomyia smithii]
MIEEFIEEEEVKFDMLNGEQIELYLLLKLFDLSDYSIDLFLENGYKIDTLRIIQRREIEALLVAPHLAERTKFIHEINKWRKSLGLPLILEPLQLLDSNTTAGSSATSTSKPSTTLSSNRQTFTAQFLITRSHKGKNIIKSYNELGYPKIEYHKAISHIVVDEFKDRFGRLTHEELLHRGEELEKLFPTEHRFSWYQPTYIKDSNGNLKRLGKYAKGSLYNRNLNYKPVGTPNGNKENAQCTTRPLPANLDCTVLISPTVEMEFEETKTWLKHHEDQWEELKAKWESTSFVRLHQISQIQNRRICSILAEYPALRNTRGYMLVQIDFRFKFPENDELLFKAWPEFRKKIFSAFKADVSDADGKKLMSFLLQDDLTDDCRDYLTFALLINLVPSSVIFLTKNETKSRPRWKPSLAESREAYLMNVKCLNELEADISRLLRRYNEKGFTLAPLLIAV